MRCCLAGLAVPDDEDAAQVELLPGSTTLVAQYFHIGCSNKPSLAITGHEVLREKFPGFTAGEHAQ